VFPCPRFYKDIDWRLFRLFFTIISGVPNARTCVVSYWDTEGMEHSVEESATSVYEAAALGLQSFRKSSLTSARPGQATLRVTVRAEESREVRVSALESRLGSGGKSPREQALKGRLWEALDGR